MKIEDLDAFIEDKTLFLGHDVERQGEEVKRILGPKALIAPSPLWALRASAVGMVGLQRVREEGYDELHGLVPTYLRPPDIRPNPYPLIS